MSSAIPKFTASGKNGTLLHSVQRSPCLNSPASISQFSLRKPQNDAFGISRLSLKSSSRMVNDRAVRMALVDERRLARSTRVTEPSGVLVEWSSSMDKSVGDPPTAVLLHGILGSRKNWGTFAKRLAQEFPMWQFLLVDLRCHGDSASVSRRGPHSVASTALDVLKLVAHLRITPRVLIGHSFGGKVVLSMVDQAAKPLARPIRVWVLDATPGKVRAGGDGEDHPSELISFLRRLSTEVTSKREVVSALLRDGFSKDVAQWVVTNLRPSGPPSSPSSKFSWMFDLEGISEMYNSYEETNLWKFVDSLPRGVHLNFLKAERSLHRWALEDLQRIHAAEDIASEEGSGVEMHVLEDAGHWVHTDNPDGLFRILSPSFQGLKT
ncbi:Putative esterase/lipase HI_0193 [Linum perenne]